MAGDPPGQVGIGQEVLSESLGGTDAVAAGERLQRPAPQRRAITS
jgi:hypothetical protein